MIKIGPHSKIRKSSATKYSTVNALWDTTYMFEDVMLTDEEFGTEKVTIGAYDRNALFKNELIGSYEFSLENIYRQKGHEYYRKWVPLTVPTDPGYPHGHMLCSIYVLKEGDPTPSHEGFEPEEDTEEVLEEPELKHWHPYFLNVLIYKAQNLVPTHSYRGSINPFVSVRFNGNTIQTKRMSNVSNPVWNRKFEMPFHMPLDSDAIEVQVWNHRFGRPDVLIGSASFSYFQMRLTHRSWGPKWVNLYSANYTPPTTTLLGSIVDSLTSNSNATEESEYVGRILVRLSVAPVRKTNPRLFSLPCNPTREPAGDEYALYFVLYSGSEIPVLGGKVLVELTFGAIRVQSRAVLGKDGVFVWNQPLENIFLYCPQDLHQVHDVIVNVYHQSGSSSRKIAFERIPVANLLPDRNNFYLNGEEPILNDYNMWRPKWRTMKHTHKDPKKAHVIAGFLLCSIGFGLREVAPPKPKIHKTSRDAFVLQAKVYHAANLPAANGSGSANPFLVIRYAGSTAKLPVKKDTLYPFWYENHELQVDIDRRHAPSVYLMMYHQGVLGQKLIGRAEILTDDIIGNKGKIMRFPLYSSEHATLSQEQLIDCERVPYILASFHLVPYDPDIHAFEIEDHKFSIPQELLTSYTFKMEAIGLRRLLKTGLTGMRSPELQIDYPSCDPNEETEPARIYTYSEAPEGGSLSLLENIFIPRVKLPLFNLHSVPIRIRLFNDGPGGKSLVGVYHAPLANFIQGTIEQPPFYVFQARDVEGDIKSDEDSDGENEEESAAQVAQEEEEKKELTHTFASASNLNLLDVTKKADSLDLHVENVNVRDVFKTQQWGTGGNINHLRKADRKEKEIGMEVELREENLDDDFVYHEFVLRRGEPEVSPYDNTFNDSNQGKIEAGVLKSFARVVPYGKDNDLTSENLLDPVAKIYNNSYVVRVYVYRAVNLTPKDRSFGGGQSADSYLVVRNGKSEENQFSNRYNAFEDETDPEFYQVIELPCELPGNNELSIEVWDKDNVKPDDLIGTTTIDVEWRLLHGMEKGEMEWRLLKQKDSNISHGKILVRLDILSADDARRTKPDDLRAPQPAEYELRMVIWNTRRVRFPEEKDADNMVDQQVRVEANFAGEAPITKETDTAWDSSGGSAEWNYRMIFPVKLPTKNARLKIAMWDANLVSDDQGIGEVLYNLQPFFNRALREKQSRAHQAQKWLTFTHPNYRGVNLGQVVIELWLYTRVEAEQHPAGEAQNEPNKDPYLPDPLRKPPPWAVGTKGLNMLGRHRMLILCLIVTAILLAILGPFLYTRMQGAVF